MVSKTNWKFKKAIAFMAGGILLFPLAFLLFKGFAQLPSVSQVNSDIYFDTLLLIGLTVGISSVLAILNGVFLFYSNAKRRSLFFFLLLLPLSFPTYIMAFNYAVVWEFLSFLFGISRSGIKSLLGLGFVCALCLYPYILLPFYLFLKKRAKSWFVQAKVSGISTTKLWWKVVLPTSLTSILLGASLVAYELLNDYGAAKYFGVNTVTTQIFKLWFGKNQLGEAMALAMFLLFWVIAFKWIASLFKVKEARESNRYDEFVLGPNYWMAVLLKLIFIFTVISALVFPLCAMLYGLYFDWDLQNWETLFSAGLNSFVVSALNAVITIGVVSLLLSIMSFQRNRFISAGHKVLSTGYSIPGAVIAVAVVGVGTTVFKAIGQVNLPLAISLNQSILLLILGLVFKLYAVAVPTVEVGWSNFGKSQVAAIKIFERFSKTNPIRKVVRPQMLKYYAGGALFIFIDTLKELPITLLLRPFNFETLAVKAYNLVEDEFLYRAAPYSLIISIFCGLGIYFFNRINSKID